jgi:hypothetical protein
MLALSNAPRGVRDRPEQDVLMTNPYVGSEYETAWDQGYSYGYYYPNDTDPSPPAPFVDAQATAYGEGAEAGRVAVAGAGEGAMTGNAGGGGYSSAGYAPSSSESGPVTIPETTIVGDPNSVADPNSADDAYAAGYNDGYRGVQEDSSAFAETVKSWYHQGYSEGGGLHRTEPHEHSEAAEVAEGVAEVGAPVIIDHWVLHALLQGAPWTELAHLAITPGGDTQLSPPDAYMPVCHQNGHGLGGDAVFDGGSWHGTATLDLAGAQYEATDHSRQWGHDGSVHIWVFDKDNEWNMDITLDP